MELRQEMKLKQTLSQNMILSARILQMGQAELSEYLQETALENPVVDLEEAGAKSPSGKEENREDLIRRLEELQSMDMQNRQYYQEDAEGRMEPAGKISRTLEEALLEQLLVQKLSDRERAVLKYLIMNLDDNGYLTCGLETLCEEMGIEKEQGEEALGWIQRLEPRGVGARDLRECLLLQLEDVEAETSVKELARRIVEESLEELGGNRMAQLARRYRCKVEKIVAACTLIRSLNPRPGSGYGSHSDSRFLTPDVLVLPTKDGFELYLNDGSVPQLKLNPYYLSLLKTEVSREAEEYIRDKVKQAQWVCQCVEQRKRTLLLLAQEILTVQEAFFRHGRGHMAPLSQRETAKKLGLSESTVSRTVREKYLQCRWGIFPLQHFFTGGSVCGEQQAGTVSSTEAVKERLRLLIQSEDKKKPFSDRVLSERLEEEGIALSRRTVAKYRESMGIPDAAGRKTYI